MLTRSGWFILLCVGFMTLAGCATNRVPEIAVVLPGTASWVCPAGHLKKNQQCIPTSEVTRADVAEEVMWANLSGYYGNCPCPWSLDSRGRQCGGRSAYSRPGGQTPTCYPSQVTFSDIDNYIENNLWALELYTEAMKGDTASMVLLANFYSQGVRPKPWVLIQRNVYESARWAQKAHASGSAQGTGILGNLHMFGDGVPKDEELGHSLLLDAAQKGDPFSQYNVAQNFANGRGTTKDEKQAVKWWMAAANQKQPDALLMVALLFYQSGEILKSKAFAAQALEYGNKDAQELLQLLDN